MALTCDECGKKLKCKKYLKRHQETVHKEHKHTCEQCGKTFPRKDSLLRHEKQLHSLARKRKSTGRVFETSRKRRICETTCEIAGTEESVTARRQTVDEGNPIVLSGIAINSSGIEDDLAEAPEDLPDTDVGECYRSNWSSIRTKTTITSKLCHVYNKRLVSTDPKDLCEVVRHVFQVQKTAFKFNFSLAFILRNKESGILRYFHSSSENNCVLSHPVMVRKAENLQDVSEALEAVDMLESARLLRPDSTWTVEMVCNATVYIYKITDHPIGRRAILPDFVQNNKGLYSLTGSTHGPYNDNLCFFRCLAKHHKQRLFETYSKKQFRIYLEHKNAREVDFEGVTVRELPMLEELFNVSIYVYKLEKVEESVFAELVYRPLSRNEDVMYLNLYEDHFSYIHNLELYLRSFSCSVCGTLWKSAWACKRHEKSCKTYVNYRFPGGAYKTPLTVFEKLQDEGIDVHKNDRYYPYRAIFDIECMLKKVALSGGRKLEWTSIHEILSVGITSNVEGFDVPKCFISDGRPEQVIEDMLGYLLEVSQRAYGLLKDKFAWVYEAIEEVLKKDLAKSKNGENQGDSKQKPKRKYGNDTTRFKRYMNGLKDEFDNYLKELPVIGFNSGKYDLNVLKKYLIPKLLFNQTIHFVVKKSNNIKCIKTDNFKFLDITNYLAPGFSYRDFLKAYDVKEKKGYFPYEYITDTQQLTESELPSHDKFFSSLKNEHITTEEYALCQKAWADHDMKTMGDFLLWYSSLDVEPMKKAIEKMVDFYKDLGLDTFKDGISVPGLTLKYLFKEIGRSYFTLVDENNKDIYELFKRNIVGGPSIVFHRYHERNQTRIREWQARKTGETPRLVKRILGLDVNALYLHGLMKEMPTETFIRRREETGYKREYSHKFGRKATQWLDYEADRKSIQIRHQFNAVEKRVGQNRQAVDGFCSDLHKIFQFHGCFFHGHDCRLTRRPNGSPLRLNKVSKRKMNDLYKETLQNRDNIKSLGYQYEEIWECEWERKKEKDVEVQKFLKRYQRPTEHKFNMTKDEILAAIESDQLFGVIECDIRVPVDLREKFAEMPPIFKHIDVSLDDNGHHMKTYATENGLSMHPRRSLIGSFTGYKILLATPLVKWYLSHGLCVSRVYQVIEYKPARCFEKFGRAVSKARREGDHDPKKAILADTFKLMGNSAYGKTVTNKERFLDVTYCDELKTSRKINNHRFRHVSFLADDVYEVEMTKRSINIDLPLQIGFFVYQYAKLRMLEFYYDFMQRFIDERNFQYVQMDTDSAYIALSADSLEEVIKPDLKFIYEKEKDKWFPKCDTPENKAYYKREPGLLKTEWEGDGCVALCSKTYFCFGGKTKDKVSCKGLQKRGNDLDKEVFLDVILNRTSRGGENRGFRMKGNEMFTYVQRRDALSYLYLKRKVMDDGVSTEPLEI